MPKYNNPRRTWKYTNNFKVNVVQLSFTANITIKAVAENFDIHPLMPSRCRKEYREGVDKRKKIMGQSLTKKALTKEQKLEREDKQFKEPLFQFTLTVSGVLEMNEKKLKHLEFIQNIMTRMNSNSFLIKGWAVTLMSALFALSAKDANVNYIWVVYFIIPVFWGLDGFFLSTEKKFRKLYQEVANKEEGEIDFSMTILKYTNDSESWLAATLSKTLIPFYGFLLLVVIIVMCLLM